jgi:hypothetical protein
MRPNLLLLLPLIPALASAQKDSPKETPTIAARTETMTHMPGLLPLDWDANAGKLYVEIPHFNAAGQSEEFL